jgi:NitT/TauT family transport system substrate-binding protein
LPYNLSSENLTKVKIGVLQYGSVNWELDLIKTLELDKNHNFDLEIVQLASKNAAAVALQGKSVDMIVTDWFWVSRQRSQGRMFSFFPHSMAAGGLIVKSDSGIKKLEDLKGKKIGIAGGQVDKSWLIFRAYYKKKHGTDLISLSRPIFGAPPLLNKKMQQSGFDAILTYWPYQAKLLTDDNFKKIININEILNELGIPDGIPVIGWVFRDDWGKNNNDILNNFLKASDEAKKIMLESDKIWEKIRPNMMAEDDLLFSNLREIYREGIPKKKFTKTQIEGAKKLYPILSKIGGKELVGNAKELSPGTFWSN